MPENTELLKLVSDEQVAETFANTNFGPVHPRDMIAETLLKIASGYHSGSTAVACCVELGLMERHKKTNKPSLTKKGGYYLYEVFNNPKYKHEK